MQPSMNYLLLHYIFMIVLLFSNSALVLNLQKYETADKTS